MTIPTPNRRLAPSEKLRGKRRYFDAVRREAASFELEIDEGSWWDRWHYHADWPGWGNLCWRNRREHLRALCSVFLALHGRRAEFSTPFQAWIQVDGEDAGQDAVYLHTPNPNGSGFPWRPEAALWEDSPLLAWLRLQLPGLELHHGRSKGGDRFVYAEGLGEPLRTS